MGTACSKLTKSIPTTRTTRTTTTTTATTSTNIDYGYLVPQGIYTAADTDYDLNVVRSLIRKGHLAPFYKGSNEPILINKLSYETECPICFLFYPSKMNRTRCCDKSICTECFLQLRRSSTSPLVPAVCPFCVQPNLGVIYIPPPWSKKYNAFKKRRSDLFIKSAKRRELHQRITYEDDDDDEEEDKDSNTRRTWRIEANDPDVVLVDTVRPRWQDMLEERGGRSSAIGSTRRRRVHLNNSSRRVRQQSYEEEAEESDNDSHHTIYDTFADMDLEDLLVMEAIRLSLLTAAAASSENNNNNPGDEQQEQQQQTTSF